MPSKARSHRSEITPAEPQRHNARINGCPQYSFHSTKRWSFVSSIGNSTMPPRDPDDDEDEDHEDEEDEDRNEEPPVVREPDE